MFFSPNFRWWCLILFFVLTSLVTLPAVYNSISLPVYPTPNSVSLRVGTVFLCTGSNFKSVGGGSYTWSHHLFLERISHFVVNHESFYGFFSPIPLNPFTSSLGSIPTHGALTLITCLLPQSRIALSDCEFTPKWTYLVFTSLLRPISGLYKLLEDVIGKGKRAIQNLFNWS